ncbi:MAG: acyltransferase domain-containing protein, partial [Dehalococcoidia bacterium]|nr:acyltransferase domain-containing protein [Dehalococcoidia bacterium]
MCVVSGPGAEIDRLEKRLSDEGVLGRRLATSHAFHSRMMKPMLGEFEEVMRSVSLSAPRIPIVSNTTGRLLSSQQATDPSYWTEHASKPVLFAAGVDLLLGQGCEIFLEVGPSNTLTKIVGRLTNNATVIPSLPHPRERSTDQETLSRAVGRAWTQGVDLSWQALAENDETRPLDLPPYPFAHDRHWVDMPGRQSAMHEPPQHAASEVDLDDWFYQPSWHRDEERPGDTGRPVRCLVFHNDEVLEVRLRDALEHMGTTVYTVRPGDRCEQFEDGRFTIRADVQEDYATLVEQLDDAPDLVLHLWTLPGDSVSGQALDLGFYSLLYLAQSLPRKFVSPCQWLVCSPSCYAVTGMENLAPVHATLSGITAVIPLEFPALVCRHVDLDACDPGVVAVQILREMRTNDSPNLTAWRNGERWIRSWAPLDLPQPARTTAVKAGETYLITGGLGSMGLAFAEYMGGQAPCRIVLTGRSQFPEREQWEALLRMAANRDPNGEDLSPDPDNPTVDFPGASILDQVEGFEREAEPVRDLQSTCQAIR